MYYTLFLIHPKGEKSRAQTIAEAWRWGAVNFGDGPKLARVGNPNLT